MEKAVHIKLVDYGKTRAFVEIQIGGMRIKDFKVLQGESGPWVAFPSREYTKDGVKKYAKTVYFPEKEDYEKFCKWVLDAYERECNK